MADKVWQRTVNLVWIGLILSTPITSMPAVVQLMGSDTVASPAGLFLFVLFFLWLIPFILRRGRFSSLVVPFVGFVLVSLVSTIGSIFLVFPPYENVSFFRNSAVALITLGVGAAFYFVTQTVTRNRQTLEKTMRWVHAAGAVVIFWCLIQFSAWHVLGGYPQWLRDFHDLYSIAPLYNNRVSGFALEPSWLAHQLNILFLPLWLAATIQRHTFYKVRLWKLSVENVLLVGGVLCLFLSFSRIGWAAFLFMLLFLSIRANIQFVRWIEARPFFQVSLEKQNTTLRRWLISAGISLVLIVVYLIVVVGLAYVFSQLDPRMEDLFTLSFLHETSLLEYADSLNFSTRIIYWQAGWKVFNDYPVLGVGLGNSGYFFPQNLDPFAWKLVEVRDLIYRSSSLLNTKNLWVRLLSETGIVGFAFFTGWCYAIWQASGALEKSGRAIWQTAGLAGKLMFLALVLEGFSIDSFAMPYLWISSGLVSGAFYDFVHSKQLERQEGEVKS